MKPQRTPAHVLRDSGRQVEFEHLHRYRPQVLTTNPEQEPT
ncbi:hypothetical protein ACFYR1_50280 [Streptomyces canus]